MLKLLFIVTALLTNVTYADKNDIITNLEPFFGKINTKDIVKTPFDGVYEVVLRDPIDSILVSKNGRYLIQGDVIDLTIKSKMPASNTVQTLKKALIDGVSDKDKIIFKAKNEKYVINVFTDVDCPFCKKLHSGMSEMNELGITVKYMAYPIAGLHPTAQGKMEKIWCSDNPAKALDDYKRKDIDPTAKACDNPVAAQLELAKKLGIRGTPAIFLENGAHIPGYLKPKKLLKRLENISK